MDRLPTETFITIMSLLDISDKLNCALVCQNWHRTLKTTNLYNTLTMGQDVHKFYKAMEMFVENEHAGQQVTDLFIRQYGNIDPHSVLSLPRYFPNVWFLKWYDLRYVSEANIRPNPIRLEGDIPHTPTEKLCARELKYWGQLHHITAVNGEHADGFLPLVVYLLGSTVFSNLTSLDFSFMYNKRFGTKQATLQRYRPLAESLIKNLKNAPAIQSLSLRFLALDLYDIEEIHTNAPNLKKNWP